MDGFGAMVCPITLERSMQRKKLLQVLLEHACEEQYTTLSINAKYKIRAIFNVRRFPIPDHLPCSDAERPYICRRREFAVPKAFWSIPLDWPHTAVLGAVILNFMACTKSEQSTNTPAARKHMQQGVGWSYKTTQSK